MNNTRALKIVIVLLTIVLLTSLAFLSHALLQNIQWKQTAYVYAEDDGARQAQIDIEEGQLRLFVISGERDENKFSGTNAGPFQVWFPQYYTNVYPLRYSIEQEVLSYNKTMRFMHKHPGVYLTKTNAIEQRDTR